MAYRRGRSCRGEVLGVAESDGAGGRGWDDLRASTGGWVPVESWRDLDDARLSARHVLNATQWDFLMGGSEREGAIRNARTAYVERALIPRVLTGAAQVALTTTVLGMPAAAPFCACPVGTQTMFHPDGERGTAAGARARSLPAVIGCMASVPFADVSAATDRWAIQIYPFADRTITHEIMLAALEAGASAVVYTADVPVPGRRLRDQRNGFAGLVDARPHSASSKLDGADIWAAWTPTYTWDDIAALIAAARVPFGVKGVLHPDDAIRAVEAGVHTVWVSSHGGRQLDDAIAPLDALPRIADAVAGAAEIVIDGSLLSGADAAKALALGADAVAVGRAAMWGLAAAGAEGVARVFELLTAQLENVLLLMGLDDPRRLTRTDLAYMPDVRRGLDEAAASAP